MLSWGIGLIVVGVFSFVLPLFGRQFIIVEALGLTGASGSVVGLALIAVGAFLAHLSKDENNQNQNQNPFIDNEDQSSNIEPQETRLVRKIIEERNVEARSLDKELAIKRAIEARLQGQDMLVSIKKGIPNVLNMQGAQLCKEITILIARGSSEDEAITIALSTYLEG